MHWIEISIRAQAERGGHREKKAAFGAMTLSHHAHVVLAVFGPFNFRGHLPNGNIVPALLAGNCVLFKPSELTPGVGALMMAAWDVAGLPAGVLNLVQGARDTGAALLDSHGLNGVLFTGSAHTGALIHRKFAGRPDVILALELGGNNPLIVWPPVDAKAAANLIVHSAFATSGQRCTCARRLIVPQGAEGDAISMRVDDEKAKPDTERIKQYGVSLDYAVLGLCQKRKLLDYIENFILYYNNSVKICTKNHQFLGVNNGVASFQERLEKDKAGDTKDKGKLGVFWHTQGSGKSYSMIFFTRKVFRKFTGNYTFVIVTDRDDLDDQIYRNFLGAAAVTKSDKCRPKNSNELRDILTGNQRFVFTLIQKFRYEKGKAYPVLSERNDIVVIIDEAHRTQYKDLTENMRTGLPAAQYMAFTGTPLSGSRQLTNDWFGKTISEYNFKQSVDDNATSG